MDNKKINRTRNNKITVYFSDAELERLNSKVDRTLLNREQFIRNMVEELTIVEAPPAPLWQTVIMMKDATNSLKEISDRCFLSGKLYEDNATGKVSDEWFMQLSHKYEVERLELKAKIKTLRQKLSECGQCERDRETFTSAIRRFMRMDKLTAPLLRELIDHIDVFETEGTGKSRTQRIVIYYRFVGYVEIPEVSQKKRIKADTRKGVAVEYLTEPLPA